MNLSLKRRVAISFGIATVAVMVLAFVVYNFLDSLNKDIEKISVGSAEISMLTDEIRISAVSLLKYQRRISVSMSQERTDRLIKKSKNLCGSFISQLQRLDALFSDVEVKKIISQMLGYVDSLKVFLSKGIINNRFKEGETIGGIADKILDSFSDFQEIQSFQNAEKDKRIGKIVYDTKKNMMYTLIICFLATIILGLVIPGKIALPFKKIKDAIRELQECNFDVSIFYNQDDEIGEIAREMNKMIQSFKVFEELRADRIAVEHRKFDALANMVKKPVLVANADNKLIYMNNQLYSLMQVQSEDVIGKEMSETVISKSIIDCYNLAIKRRSKIDNIEIVIRAKKIDLEEDNSAKEIQEDIFNGYATVIPIRGKESSLDYYLMVLSTEIFV